MPTDPQLARLRSENAQLKVLARRYTLQQRAARRAAPERRPVDVAPLPLAPVDPRPAPQVGSKVLPPFSPPLTLGKKMGQAIARELQAMAIETRTLIRALAKQSDTQTSMDAAPGEREFEELRARWAQRFETLARVWARRMVTDIGAQSSAQLEHGLRDIASLQSIRSTLSTPRMRALVEAATEASVGLITRIPQRFLGDVQTQVMSAVTTGSGLDKLVPYLTKRYKGDARWAHLVALDQIRKVSESVNATRLQSLGVEEYVWMAVGGERYPRKLHHEHLNGKTFRYDDPPVIQTKPEVRGKPGDLPFCRCRARPVVNFTKLRAA